jgi:[acyl-carrier-protein] S-malonyltransferase
VRLVQQRGKFMQEAVPAGQGAMAAVLGLDDEQIVAICAEACAGDVVAAVNFNSPGQVVIAGHATAVDRAVPLLKAAGAKRAMPLPVSAPFHTALMQPAADRLAQQILATTFNAPQIPVVHNVTAQLEQSPEAIKQLMIQQISAPVLWSDCVKTMAAAGITVLVECGPGKVLAGLAKRIDKNLTAFNTETPEELEKTIAELS